MATICWLSAAILDTGAYCAAMSSNYNMRPRALEIGMQARALEIGMWARALEICMRP